MPFSVLGSVERHLAAGAADEACSAAQRAFCSASTAPAISSLRPRPLLDRSNPITCPESREHSIIQRTAFDLSQLSAAATLAIVLIIFGGRRTGTAPAAHPVRSIAKR